MKRREFLKSAGVGLAASTAVAAPAIAQSMPEIKWRMATSWPKSLDTLYGGCEYFAKRVAEMTDNKFQIQVFAAGEIVPGPAGARRGAERHRRDGQHRLLLLLRQGCGLHLRHGAPVRPQHAQMNAWLRFGEGEELMNELLAKFNCIGFAAGNTGAQMGGFFRKEIKTVDDLKGLKIPHRRHLPARSCSGSASCRSSLPPATSIRRWRRARSTPPNGSVRTTTRSSAS